MMSTAEVGGGEPPSGTEILDTPAAGGLVIRGGVLRGAGYVVGVALSVLAVAILIRQLGAADYGRYITVISLITLLGALSDLGMTNLGVREYSTTEGAQRDHLMRQLLGLRLAVSALGALAAVAFALAAGYTATMVAGAAIGGVGLVVANVQAALSVPLASRLVWGRLTALDVLRQVVTVAATVAVAAAGWGLLAYLSIPVPAALVLLVITVWWVRGAIPLIPGFDREAWASFLRVTASFAAASAVGTLYVYLVVLVMSLITNEAEVGYFGASFRVFIVVGAVAGLLVGAAFPVLARAARDDHTRLAYALQRLFEVSVIVGALAAIGTLLGAPVAIDVIAGSGFDPAVGTLRIQAAAVFASFLLATWGFALISLHRHAALLYANAAALIVALAAALALVPSMGAHGAALATVIGESTLAAGYAIALMGRDRRLRPSLSVVLKVLPAAALATAAGLLPGFGPVAAVVVASVVFVAAVLVLRAVPQELLDAARGLRRR